MEAGAAGAWIEAGQRLANSAESRVALGLRARQYAEANFDIEKIVHRFEAVVTKAAERCFHKGSQTVRHGNLPAALRRWPWLSD